MSEKFGDAASDLMTLTPTPPTQAAVDYWTRVMSRQVNDRFTDTRSPLANRPIQGARPSLLARVKRAFRKHRKRSHA